MNVSNQSIYSNDGLAELLHSFQSAEVYPPLREIIDSMNFNEIRSNKEALSQLTQILFNRFSSFHLIDCTLYGKLESERVALGRLQD